MIDKHDKAHNFASNYFRVSGEIPRVTEYELGLRKGLRHMHATGTWELDTLIKDERFLYVQASIIRTSWKPDHARTQIRV